MTDQNPSTVSQSGLSDSAAGGLAYVTVIPAIVFLIIEPYNKIPFVRFHSWQSIFMAISWIVIEVGLTVLRRVPGMGLLTLFIGPIVGLCFLVLWIIVLINAFNGKRFKVPVIGDFAEKQANG